VADDTGPIITAIRRALARSHTIDQSVEALSSELRHHVPVHRTSVRLLDPDGIHLVLVSVWSTYGTNLQVGTRLRTEATSFSTILGERRPVFSEELDEDPLPLLDQIIQHEGVQSWVSCPLQEEGRPVGILSLSSRAKGAFCSEDWSFFSEVVRISQDQLLRQARTALPRVSDQLEHAHRAEARDPAY
jgi:GAF domain-containing protein